MWKRVEGRHAHLSVVLLLDELRLLEGVPTDLDHLPWPHKNHRESAFSLPSRLMILSAIFAASASVCTHVLLDVGIALHAPVVLVAPARVEVRVAADAVAVALAVAVVERGLVVQLGVAAEQAAVLRAAVQLVLAVQLVAQLVELPEERVLHLLGHLRAGQGKTGGGQIRGKVRVREGGRRRL